MVIKVVVLVNCTIWYNTIIHSRGKKSSFKRQTSKHYEIYKIQYLRFVNLLWIFFLKEKKKKSLPSWANANASSHKYIIWNAHCLSFFFHSTLSLLIFPSRLVYPCFFFLVFFLIFSFMLLLLFSNFVSPSSLNRFSFVGSPFSFFNL